MAGFGGGWMILSEAPDGPHIGPKPTDIKPFESPPPAPLPIAEEVIPILSIPSAPQKPPRKKIIC